MHLLSCEHPQRVFNKYIGEYIWTTCGKCNACKVAKAARWTDALERERLLHRYCFFVTLTYDDVNLPLLRPEYFSHFEWNKQNFIEHDISLIASRTYDNICIPFKEIDFEHSDADEALFFNMIEDFGGIPYCSSTDIQYFNKRLNKYFHDNATSQFKNFRYFCVQEFGSTTLRPHVHGIYYTDRRDCAEIFQTAVDVCWQRGRTDCKYVENSACAYVAQYVNKLSDLPLFYQKAPLAPRYLFSKHIGFEDFTNSLRAGSNGSIDLQKVFDNESVEVCYRGKANSTKLVVRPLDKATQNYLFPKCPLFKQVSYTCRVELYNISSRFPAKGFENFLKRVEDYLLRIYEHTDYNFRLLNTEFSDFLYNMFYLDWTSGDEDKQTRAYGWLRRLYYLSKHVIKLACIFKVSVLTYVNKIVSYFDKKELYLLKQMYTYQAEYVSKKDNCSDDLSLMYPEYLTQTCGISLGEYISSFDPFDVRQVREDSASLYYSNKKTHFKNAYLDSLKLKDKYSNFFNHLKSFYYAKKCNETLETFSA